MNRFGMACTALSLLIAMGCGGQKDEKSEAQNNARVFFKSPADGATVPTTFKVEFGLAGMELAPGGTEGDNKNKGHHHLIINEGHIAGDPPEVFKHGQTLPGDRGDRLKHYGAMQEKDEITLPPGKYTLTLQFADGNHRSYGKQMRASIKVTVKDGPIGNPSPTPSGGGAPSVQGTAPTSGPMKTPSAPVKAPTPPAAPASAPTK